MKKLSKFAPLVGVFLFVFIILNIDINQLVEILSGFKVRYFLLVLVIDLPILMVRVFKWRMLIRSCQIQYGLIEAIIAFYIASFVAVITPGRIGEFAKAFYLKKSQNITFGKSISTIIADRILDVIVLLVFAVSGVAIFSYLYGIGGAYLTIILFFLMAFAVVAAFVMNKKLTRYLLKPVFNKFIPDKYRSKIKVNYDDFYSGTKLITNKKSTLILAGGLTVIIWLGRFLQFYLLATGLGINISYFLIALISPTIVIIEMIPISFTGIGAREAALILFFSVLAISPAAAVSYSLVVLLYQYVSTLPGLFLWLKKPIEL